MTQAQAQEKMTKAYVSYGGKNTALPWAEILAFIMKLLQGCTPVNAKAFAKSHPIALEWLVKRHVLSESNGSISNKEAGLIAKASVKAFNSASLADIEDLTH